MSRKPAIRPEPASGAADRLELAALERRQLEAHADIRERLARIEAKQESWATKEEVARLQVWVLRGVVAILLTGVGLLVRAYWGK